MMLYHKIEENNQLQKRMEQNQLNQTMYMAQVLMQGSNSNPNQNAVTQINQASNDIVNDSQFGNTSNVQDIIQSVLGGGL